MEDPQLHIISYCSIAKGQIFLDGQSIYEETETDFANFIKGAYKELDGSYSKFFKMDELSKLAFIASGLLLEERSGENIALVISNRASSLDTDRKHQASIQYKDSYYPSPAIFVYTLPNICLGEISIRHNIHSENSFFIFEHFDPDHLHAYAESLIHEKKAGKVLCGWVDFDSDDYRAFVYLVGIEGGWKHNLETIKRIYTS